MEAALTWALVVTLVSSQRLDNEKRQNLIQYSWWRVWICISNVGPNPRYSPINDCSLG